MDLAKTSDELARDYGDLLGVVPYAAEVIAAYRFVRQRRVRSFLRGLGDAISRLNSEEKQRFAAYIDSLPGRELLAEFAEASLRARTQTATAAFALLYADFEGSRFSAEFRSDAVVALEGLTDRAVHAFLLLSRHEGQLFTAPDDGAYRVVAVTGAVVAANNELSTWSVEATAWIGVVADLVRRGLLSPDWAAGSRLGGDDWMAYFAFSSMSAEMATLLTEELRESAGGSKPGALSS